MDPTTLESSTPTLSPTPRAGWWRRHRRLRGMLVALTATVAVLALSYLTVRPWLLNIGSRVAERHAAMPGDNLVADADTVMTRAVTLSGPPEQVWPWLVQMGEGRGGFYGYDWLENTFGDTLSNATRVHPEWQDLRSGGHMSPMPGAQWPVPLVEPNRTLLVGDGQWSWALVLKPVGEHQTRLVTRMRWARPHGPGAWLYTRFFHLGDAMTVTRQLDGLEQRVTGTLPGMPGTSTGAPVPTARLPLAWWAALGWLVALTAVATAAARLLAARRGGWLLLLAATAAYAYAMWTDTNPWLLLRHHWAGGLLVAAVLIVAERRLRRQAPTPLGWRARARGFVPAVCVGGLAVALPALTTWQALTRLGVTDHLPGLIATTLLAAGAATAVSTVFWRKALRTNVRFPAVGAAVLAVAFLVTGSVLAVLVTTAVVLPDRVRGWGGADQPPGSAGAVGARERREAMVTTR